MPGLILMKDHPYRSAADMPEKKVEEWPSPDGKIVFRKLEQGLIEATITKTRRRTISEKVTSGFGKWFGRTKKRLVEDTIQAQRYSEGSVHTIWKSAITGDWDLEESRWITQQWDALWLSHRVEGAKRG